jgi:hypothetical protein
VRKCCDGDEHGEARHDARRQLLDQNVVLLPLRVGWGEEEERERGRDRERESERERKS